MEKLVTYRQYVKEVLNDFCEFRRNASIRPEARAIAVNPIFDEANDRYAVVIDGWTTKRRDYGLIMHIDIKSSSPEDAKIWVQYNGTEVEIVQQLLDRGVPKEDLVLGYHHPSIRSFTEFALG